jgi:hypothetical protein
MLDFKSIEDVILCLGLYVKSRVGAARDRGRTCSIFLEPIDGQHEIDRRVEEHSTGTGHLPVKSAYRLRPHHMPASARKGRG